MLEQLIAFLPLLIVPMAYRLKGMGVQARWLTLSLVSYSIGAAAAAGFNGSPLWQLGLGTLFTLGAVTGHGRYFGMAINGTDTGEREFIWADRLMFVILPKQVDESPFIIRARGGIGLFIRALCYLPFFMALSYGASESVVPGIIVGQLFALFYATGYLTSRALADKLIKIEVGANRYNVYGEWQIGIALMVCIFLTEIIVYNPAGM